MILIDATKPDGTVVLLTTLFGYDFNQNLTTITQPMSNVVKNVFDQRDLLASVTRVLSYQV
ncbi:MAG: hypothetical protein L6Q71_10835 [Planctomycetes bacterium]|nr:hypothetical protein [Planctomycetota bacterium]